MFAVGRFTLLNDFVQHMFIRIARGHAVVIDIITGGRPGGRIMARVVAHDSGFCASVGALSQTSAVTLREVTMVYRPDCTQRVTALIPMS